ncbi:MAG TPA: hypothetical protein VG604_01370 [Candidatus Saccharimonadales bacterium]|nr:hypothetical protein [Candidatus Saccharimonadales bacterium]
MRVNLRELSTPQRLFVILAIIGLGVIIFNLGSCGESGKLKLPRSATYIHKPYQFPNGGRTIFPRYRLVALYGTPAYPALGALGQQSLPASIAWAKRIAASYQPLVHEHVLPTLEIIASIASGTPTENGDYSQELPISELTPWVKAARQNGVYVVLDLQTGRSSFLKEAKDYASLLKQPNVGLALDPEWRLTSTQVPLEQIGSVGIDEVNQTTAWLSQLTQQSKLPQKLVVLHQFRIDMIQHREKLDTAHSNLVFVIQMDGSGAQSTKLDTWHNILENPPAGVRFGWKNFYREDPATLSPAGTMSLTPRPWYVSYQ